MAEQMLTDAEMREAIRDPKSVHYLTESECRDALTFLSGWTPEGVSKAIAFIGRQRKHRAERDRHSDLPDRAAALREECTR